MQSHEELWQEAEPYIKIKAYLDLGLPIQQIADFCGVTLPTVLRWLRFAGPSGLSLIKVRSLLKNGDVQLAPIDYATREIQYTFDLLGNGIITLEEAMNVLDQNQVQMFYRVYRGASTTKQAIISYDELVELYGETLHDERQRWSGLLQGLPVLEPESPVVELPVVASSYETTVETEPEVEPPEEVLVEPQSEPIAEETPRKVPDTVMLSIANTLSSTLPSLRVLLDLESRDQLREYLLPLLGDEGAQLLKAVFGDTVTKKSVETEDSGETVLHVAKLLRRAAPDIQALYDNHSKEGALARENLRQSVGPETFSVLTVQLTAMRSRQAYEKATKGEIN